LLDDWESVDPAKQELLSSYQFPAIGPEGVSPGEAATPVAGATPADSATASAPTVAPAAPPAVSPDALQVRFRMPHATTGGQDAKPEFIITNSGPEPVSLAHVALFYWLDDESDESLVFHCDWAAIGCSNVMGDFGSAEDGARYLRISFAPGAGSVESGADSGEIKIRFNRSDWSPLSQEGHYSFSPIEEYEVWERVTLQVDGNPVWGVAPGVAGTVPEATAPVQPVATQTVTAISPTATATGMAVAIVTVTPQEVAATGMAPIPTVPVVAPSGRGGVALGFTSMVAVVLCAVSLLALGVVVGIVFSQRRKET